jgi:hypothetical protein
LPRPDELPESLKALASRNATWVRPTPDFSRDIEVLIKGLKEQEWKPPKNGARSILEPLLTLKPLSILKPYLEKSPPLFRSYFRAVALLLAILIAIALPAGIVLAILSLAAARGDK